ARLSLAPELPTLVEEGYPGLTVSSWTGLFAPARTPPAVVTALQKAVAKVLGRPDVVRTLAGLGVEPGGVDSAAFSAFVKEDIQKWGKVVRSAHIRVD
ncbi:MAG: hypothetical protein JWQ07_5123, partial [Ramlibacter sp.]|nr:hypothetical protein [Ramlibacter sp.]